MSKFSQTKKFVDIGSAGIARTTNTLLQPSLLFFIIHLYLIHPIFLINLSELNPWDEAAYLNAGRTFSQGALPSYAGNPLIGLFYALMYLPFRNSPFWMVHSATLGRLILFALLWLGVFLIAKQLKKYANPLVMVGIFLVTPLVVEFLRFPSDPLFASLAALSLWQLLCFYNTLKGKHLWLGSLFLGLAALARNDGLALFPIFLLVSFAISWRKVHWARVILPSLVPFIGLVGGYILLYGLATGDFRPGTVERTYDNFESGHQAIFSGTGNINPTVEARLEARRIFGTPEENRYSVINAIRRNPRIYLQRVWAVTKGMPQALLQAYGIRFAALLFLLGARGVVELICRKKWLLLAMLSLWPVHLVSGFVITIFRQGHLQFPFYVVYVLASIGLTAVLEGLSNRRERYFWYLTLGGLTLYGLIDTKLAIYYGAAIFIISLWVIHTVRSRFGQLEAFKPVPLLLLLAAGLIIRGNFPSPKVRTLGDDAAEQAVVYMIDHIEPGSRVAAGTPGVVWSAKMTFMGLASTDVPTNRTPIEFLDWMRSQDIQAIYVDRSLYNNNPLIWNSIEAQIGNGIERVFTADRGNVQVLFVSP
jgi:hypothetical protein